ncbi:ABC transporter substrate-binding protein [Kytococcus schroeteri]|uniref:ABC transporter substrate-binding protein n=1 Tax=Kytococcus schroeteri TaxID=138300 RepID=A0A2I1PCY8_9MICO|nr:ABC transporter substrate-binding protein [Kytococcus schroeteri]PKZ42505.1 ABC transporter substrate-binding protein [Kytococcus schroeteri]
MRSVGATRRELLTASAAVLGTGAAAWAGGTWQAGDRRPVGAGTRENPLRIGFLPITDAAPLLVGHAGGHFARQDVHVAPPVLLRSWASVTETLMAGEVDVVHLLMPMALHLRLGLGADTTVVAWNHVNGSALTVAPHVRRLTDLAGGTVAIPAWWSIHNVVLQEMLRAEGMVPVIRRRPRASHGEVALVPMAPADMLPALGGGTLQGFTVADPFNAGAALQGVGRIHRFLGDVWRQHACCVTVVRGDLAREYPEVLQRFTRGLVEAGRWTSAHRGEAAAMLSREFLPQPPPAIAAALHHHPHGPRPGTAPPQVDHADWHGERLDFTPWPQKDFTTRLVQAMRRTVVDAPDAFLHDADPASVHARVVDDRFVRHSLEALDGPDSPLLTPRTEEYSA